MRPIAFGLLFGSALSSIGCATISEQQHETLLSTRTVPLPPRPDSAATQVTAEGRIEKSRITVTLFEEQAWVHESVEEQVVRVETVRTPDSAFYVVGDLAAVAVGAGMTVAAQLDIESCHRNFDAGCGLFSGIIVRPAGIATMVGFGTAAFIEAIRARDVARSEARRSPPIVASRTLERSGLGAGHKVTFKVGELRRDAATDAQGIAVFEFDPALLPGDPFILRLECDGRALPDVILRRASP